MVYKLGMFVFFWRLVWILFIKKCVLGWIGICFVLWNGMWYVFKLVVIFGKCFLKLGIGVILRKILFLFCIFVNSVVVIILCGVRLVFGWILVIIVELFVWISLVFLLWIVFEISLW